MGLRQRVILIITIPAVLAMVAHGVIRIAQERNQLVEEQQQRLTLTAKAVQISVENALRDRQLSDVQHLVSEMVEQQELIDGIRLFGADLGVTFVSSPGVIGKAIPMDALRRVIYVIIAAVVLKSVCSWLAGSLGAALQEYVTRDLRNAVYAHLQRLPLAWFSRVKAGQILSRVVNDTQQTKQVITEVVTRSVLSAATLTTGVSRCSNRRIRRLLASFGTFIRSSTRMSSCASISAGGFLGMKLARLPGLVRSSAPDLIRPAIGVSERSITFMSTSDSRSITRNSSGWIRSSSTLTAPDARSNVTR